MWWVPPRLKLPPARVYLKRPQRNACIVCNIHPKGSPLLCHGSVISWHYEGVEQEYQILRLVMHLLARLSDLPLGQLSLMITI